MKTAAIGLLVMIAFAATAACSKTTPKRGTMIFETIVVGELGVNCYLLADSGTKEGVVIDPGAEPERVLAAVHRSGVKVVAVLNTHGHFDHIGGNRRLVETTGAPLMIHKEDEPFLARASTSA